MAHPTIPEAFFHQADNVVSAWEDEEPENGFSPEANRTRLVHLIAAALFVQYSPHRKGSRS